MGKKALPALLAAGLLFALAAYGPEGADTPPAITPSAEPTVTVIPEPTPAESPAPTAPIFAPQRTEKIYTGEDPRLNSVYPGISITFSLSMPHIENAAGNPAWELMNSQFSDLGAEWLRKGLEYIGTPDLKPEGDYQVESLYTIERIGEVVSIRYLRTERLAAESPSKTVMAGTYDMGTGEPLFLGDFFSITDQENGRALPRRLAEEAASLKLGPYSQEILETLLDDYSHFYFTSDALVLLFPIWEGGGGPATSTLELSIPLSRLEDIRGERMPPSQA